MPDKFAMRLGALILAGGRSKRMGRPKEWLPFRGDTLLGHTLGTLRPCADPVAVVVRSEDQELPPMPAAIDRIADEDPSAGPLAALATGLRFLRTHRGLGDDTPVFVTACDHPFLTAAAIDFLLARLGDAQIAVPEIDGFLQPLCAIYRTRVLAAADDLLARGERMPRALVSLVPTSRVLAAELRAIDPDLRFLRNVNSPEDYERALADGAP